MSNLWNDLRIGVLAVAAGIFTSMVFHLFQLVNAYYQYPHNEDYYGARNDLEWIPLTFWHTFLFILAAFIGHRYGVGPKRSLFFLWQIIGGMALLGWVLTLFVFTALEYIAHPSPYVLERAMEVLMSGEALRFATAMLAGGVFYGSLVQTASKHYVSQELTQSSSQYLPVEGMRATLLWKGKDRNAACEVVRP